VNLTDPTLNQVIRTVRRIINSCEACGHPRPLTHVLVVRDREGRCVASRLCQDCGDFAKAAKLATPIEGD
jgi:uncharacterized Zn finger protein